MTEAQQQHMAGLRESAKRAVAMYNPVTYKKVMEEAFRYYITHHPEMEYGREQQEEAVTTFMDQLPGIRGRSRKSVSALKGLILLVLGMGGAYGFLYLYFHRKKLEVSTGLIFAGLFALSFMLMALPMFFSRRKKE